MDCSNWIKGRGAQTAKLMLIGETCSKTDHEKQQVFTGYNKDLVEELLEVAGIPLSDCYFTNIIKEWIQPGPNASEVDYEKYLPLLKNEIEAIEPNVILALGSLPLKVLAGKDGIRNYRGSILRCIDHDIKVIPTIPPAALFEFKNTKIKGKNSDGMFSWKQKIHIQFDFCKASVQYKFKDFKLPKRDLRSIRSSLQLEQFFHCYKDYDKVYIDVEVYKAHLVCIGFAFTPYEGVSIPLVELADLMSKGGIHMNEMLEIWNIIARFLASPIRKIGQNFRADKVYWLETSGFVVNNFAWDAMFKLHTLSPELPKSLAFQCSILTDEPYYKHEGKEYNPHRDRFDVLLRYNAMDCCINCECDEAMDVELERLNLKQFFNDFVCEAMPIYERMEKTGLLVDVPIRDELDLKYKKLLEDKNAELKELVGHEINCNSPKQVSTLLFLELRIPRRKSTDDDTLTALINRIKNGRHKRIMELILDIRKIYKARGTFINAAIDPDGRMRFTYNQVGTETGRTSTGIIQKPIRNAKWGVSIHALSKHGKFGSDIRRMYISDLGYTFMEFDQSQAEARIVALFARDYDLLRLFDTDDVHKITASYIYDIGKELINDDQRQVGKMGRHATNYRSGHLNLSIKANISAYRAGLVIEKIDKMSPNIKLVFHAEIEDALANNRVFINPFGRRREFLDRWGDPLINEAIAHLPQGTVGDNTKRAMIALNKLKANWFWIAIESHDAFVAQVRDDSMADFYYLTKEIFEQPIDFERCTLQREPLVIPVDCKVGKSYGEMVKWKP